MKRRILGVIISAVMAISAVSAYADEIPKETIAEITQTEEEKTTINGSYDDAQSDKWFFGAVEYVNEKGIMKGTAPKQFSPDLYVTRGMLAQIIKNLDGKSDKIYWSYFDVEEDAWYADAVAWCSDAGIMRGYGSGKFGPEDNITREQLVFTLYKYAQYKSFGNLETTGIELLNYSDYKTVSGYAGGAMQWALINGIISGKENKTLDPTGNASRAEVAQVMKNFMIFYNL